MKIFPEFVPIFSKKFIRTLYFKIWLKIRLSHNPTLRKRFGWKSNMFEMNYPKVIWLKFRLSQKKLSESKHTHFHTMLFCGTAISVTFSAVQLKTGFGISYILSVFPNAAASRRGGKVSSHTAALAEGATTCSRPFFGLKFTFLKWNSVPLFPQKTVSKITCSTKFLEWK